MPSPLAGNRKHPRAPSTPFREQQARIWELKTPWEPPNPPGTENTIPGKKHHGNQKHHSGNQKPGARGIDLGKLLGKVGLTWENCWEKWDWLLENCWEKWDWLGKIAGKSGIDLGKLLGKVGLTSGKLLGKVGLTWENCWEKWDYTGNAGKKVGLYGNGKMVGKKWDWLGKIAE